MTAPDRLARVASLARLADAAASEYEWEHQITDAIVAGDGENVDRQRLADAFRFSTGHGRSAKGDRFGPMIAVEDGAMITVQVVDTPDEVCTLWDEIAQAATSPLLRARLHDLLFERRWGDVGAHGSRAIEAYLEDSATTEPPSLHSVDALGRARHLATLIRRTDLAKQATEEALRAAGASLEDPEPKPGVYLALIEILIDAGCTDAAVDELLSRARRRSTDAWNSESAIKLQRRRAPDADARKALDRELVELWLEEADRVDPLVAVMHREKAARIARERGLPDLVDRAVLAMQAADPPELARIEAELPASITPEQIEEYMNSLTADTWWASVLLVLSSGPPTGDIDRNRKLAADLAEAHPLQALFPKVRLGGDGLPRYSAKTNEDHLDDQLTDVETMGLQFHGSILTEALRRAGAAHSPTSDEILDALRGVGCQGVTANRVARVVTRFNNQDFEAAAYTGLPLVERICRELLLAIDAPLYRVQRERTPGTYPGLGALLPVLAERGLDASWYRFLRTLLSAPNGWNLRNEALHGFVEDVGALGAGLVLIAILYLANLHPESRDATSAESA